MLDTLFSQVGALLWLGVCAFAIFRGDRLERLAGGALVIAWLASLTTRSDNDLSGGVWGIMAIDGALLVLLIGLGWKTDRTWPIWAAGFQAITVLVHVVTMIDERIRTIAYVSATTIGSYGVLICIGIGALRAWQVRRPLRKRDPGGLPSQR